MPTLTIRNLPDKVVRFCLRIPVMDRDGPTRTPELQRNSAPDAAGGACYEGNLMGGGIGGHETAFLSRHETHGRAGSEVNVNLGIHRGII